MKILQISPYYPPHVGGVEYHVKGLSDGLMERGHQVGIESSCGRSNTEFIRVPCINFMYFPVPLAFPRSKADIYHSHVPSPTFAFRYRKASPHVVTYHNDVVIPHNVNGIRLPVSLGTSAEWLNKKLVEPVLDNADIVVATTKSYAQSSPVLENYLHKVKIIPNAVDASQFHPSMERDPYVAYVGRLVDYKGLGTLLDAMKEVQSKEDLKLVVVGDGYDRASLEDKAAKSNLNVEFTGRVDKKRLIDIMSRAEMLVLPSASRLEAFGIVLLEAMACETPVLACDVPGVNEVAKEGGLVFSDTSELVELILELHNDEPRRRLLGRRGRKAVEEKYSWSKVLDDIESVYSEVS